jgi:hypothetical protein
MQIDFLAILNSYKDLDGDKTVEDWETKAVTDITDYNDFSKGYLLNIGDFDNDGKLETEEYDLIKSFLDYDNDGEVTNDDLEELSKRATEAKKIKGEKKGKSEKWNGDEKENFLNSLQFEKVLSSASNPAVD